MGMLLESCGSCSQLRVDVSRGVSHYTPHFFLVLLLLQSVVPTHVTTPTLSPTMTKYQETNNGNNPYFKYMYLAGQHIFVGAQEYIYRLDLRNITIAKRSPPMRAEENVRLQCLAQQSGDYQCSNHIRAIAFLGNNIYACGTGAYNPTEYWLDLNLDQIQNISSVSLVRLKCPYDPDASCTSVPIRDGNPHNHESLYTGTFRDALNNQPTISRSQLSDDITFLRINDEEKLMEDIVFINSFDAGDYVYFFFREDAIEFDCANCGNAVFSRVARVCKNDLGGNLILRRDWTSYLKAKLDCSISGDFPFHFDHLQDVKQIGDTYYGIFTSTQAGIYGSAICAYGDAQIAEAFNGKFMEQPEERALWEMVPDENLPAERPGACVQDSTQMSEEAEQFMKDHSMMWDHVKHITDDSGVPLFYQSDISFTQLALDNTNDYTIYYLVTESGKLHKVVQWQENNQPKQFTLAIWELFIEETKVSKIEIVKSTVDSQDDQLYVMSEETIIQMSVAQCDKYTTCTDCLRDPHCGWHEWDGRCLSRKLSRALRTSEAWVSNTLAVCNDLCKVTQLTSHVVKIPGDTHQLSCSSRCSVEEVMWYFENQPISDTSNKYIMTRDHGLVVFNITAGDTGEYQCRSSNVILARHRVELDPDCGADVDCIWKKNFREWCNHFDSYQREFNNWVCLKNECLDDDTCIPESVQGQCPYSP